MSAGDASWFKEQHDRLAQPLTIPFFGVLTTSLVAVWTNMPLADTELEATTSSRIFIDLDRFREFRFVVNVISVGVAGADLRVQASPDQSTWTNLDGVDGPEVAIDAQGIFNTGWTAISPALRQVDMFLRVMGKDGNGATDPIFLSWISLR